MNTEKMPNRLINEKSPYLLQHAYNPVDWYPWGDEAFSRAINENKPIFLSIGYSTCHWCHVMEKESFEDKRVAGLLNEVFIPIKVDREERPDIDQIYMTVCQMLTGSGGWPLTIIMTPEKKPFFAGTYFPRENKYGRTGLVGLIHKIKELWQDKYDEIIRSADDISHSLTMASTPRISKEIDDTVFDKAFDELKNSFDSVYGGFGNSPKFPTPHNLTYLLRYWKRKDSAEALAMVDKTLIAMRMGGIFDQAGYGFHRYSTDRTWTVPHFEKMLYDQALLIQAYTEAYQATKNDLYKNTAEEIITYVLRDLTSHEGAFYSAEDADSEGEEGKFYLWREDEIRYILNEDADLIIRLFNIKNNGNWAESSQSNQEGTNILYIGGNVNMLSGEPGVPVEDILAKVDSAVEKLFNFRQKRIHPFKDDKILTDWNGLMISALAAAGRVFGIEEYNSAAEKALKFILDKMIDADGKILHRYRDNEAGLSPSINDYAFLIAALIDVYESTFNTGYLKKAIDLNDDFIKYFWDERDGGFYFTPSYGEEMLLRSKEIYDGAVPSGNSIAMLNLVRLARITGNPDFENKVFRIADVFSRNIYSTPSVYTQALAAIDFLYGPSCEIVICGEKDDDYTKEMIRTVNEFYIPTKVVILNPNEDKEIKNIAPFIKEQKQLQGKATAYVCVNFACNTPVNTAFELGKMLSEM